MEEEASLVEVSQVQQKLTQPTIWRFGKLVTQRDSQVAARVDGQVIWMLGQGETVEAGQVIAKLDDSSLLLSKRRNLAEIEKIKTHLKFLNREVARLQQLAKSQYSSQNQLEQTTALAEAEEIELDIQHAELAILQQKIEFSAIKAPYSGMLVERFLELGEVVAAGDAVSRIVDTINKDIQVMVPLAAWQHLSSSTPLTVSSDVDSKQLTIRQIIPVGRTESQMMEVLLGANQLSWPVGTNVKVAVPQGSQLMAMLVPRDALVIRRNSTYVYKVTAQNIAKQIRVDIGETVGSQAIVTGQLSAGDTIIIRGAERLLPNAKVNIMTKSSHVTSQSNATS